MEHLLKVDVYVYDVYVYDVYDGVPSNERRGCSRMTVSPTARWLLTTIEDVEWRFIAENIEQSAGDSISHWRDFCHSTDALSASLLKHPLKVEEGAAE